MIAESQTVFSLTLFLALSSLLAWSNRRNRTSHHFRHAVASSLLRDETSIGQD